MSKFCGNCGAQLDDNAVVCGYCGTALSADAAPATAPGAPNTQAPKASALAGIASKLPGGDNKQNIVKIGVAAVAVIIVLALFIGIIPNFTGYKGTIRKAFNAIEENDPEKFVKLLSSTKLEQTDDASEEDIEEMKEAQIELYGEIFDSFLEEAEKELGGDLKISYEIIKNEKYDKDKREKFFEEHFDDYDTDDIKAVREMKLKVTYKGDDKKKSTYVEFYVIKENGKWRLYQFSL